ncbi:phosphoribosylanthranilate isomerase [Paenibacillus thalictri]|uniref:N-(5'-phosphoribosyl)anthranilate isomerase n=1 Tax=Paenibacillus thalictri TaxID=2527873 RepID=A0A4Q9DVC1_9BACL|nr:phosphoribosylanthranilate isomerase [Paenibacillus thalictri]TBL79733.1 phosphoribosylanthranilate isomerase [Paenibacillus thalictri]
MAIVKICGLLREDTISSIAHLPIDHIGFVFAKSRRQVTPGQAGTLIRKLGAERGGQSLPLFFGVFVNPGMDQLAETLREAPLDVIQLHGQEDAAFCREVKRRFGVQVYKVFSVREEDDTAALEQLAAFRGAIDGFLLDTAGGGTGKTFDWSRIPPFQLWAKEAGIPLLIAGGLDPDNVTDLITRYNPDGVDVSSGVETDGQKDTDKITAFVERVKACV